MSFYANTEFTLICEHSYTLSLLLRPREMSPGEVKTMQWRANKMPWTRHSSSASELLVSQPKGFGSLSQCLWMSILLKLYIKTNSPSLSTESRLAHWSTDAGKSHLHDGVGCQNFFFHIGFAGRATDRSKVAHGVFGWDSFPCSGFSAHNDGLIPFIPA